MAAFVKQDITLGGLDIIAKGQTGKVIRFTRIVLGDGFLADGEKPREMTALKNLVLEVGISSVTAPGNGEAVILGKFSSADTEKGFFYRELGAYAVDPDTGEEVLYCYGNADDLAEWIPPNGGASVVEKAVRIRAVVGNAEHVTATIISGLTVTPEDLEDHNSDPEAHPGLTAGRHIATVEHGLGRIPLCELYATRWAAGTQGAGEGPGGGEESVSVHPCRFGVTDSNTVQIYTGEAYEAGPAINKLSDHEYALVYPDSVDNLLLVLR